MKKRIAGNNDPVKPQSLLSKIMTIIASIGVILAVCTTMVTGGIKIANQARDLSELNEKNNDNKMQLENKQKEINELKNLIEISNSGRCNDIIKSQEKKISELDSGAISLKNELSKMNLELSDCKFGLQKYINEADDYTKNKNKYNNELSLLKDKLYDKDKEINEMDVKIKCLSDHLGDVAEKECNIKKEGAK